MNEVDVLVKDANGKEVLGLEQGPFEPIAIIGISALMPDAPDLATFWQNIIDAKVSIRTIPKHRWIGPIEHFYREGGPGNIEEGFTYARIGAVVEGYEFDWRRWKQPPGTLTQIDLAQQWAVSVAASAIEQAGYDGETKDIDRLRTGVAFANALGGENRNLSNIRIYSNHTKELAKSQGMPEANSAAFVESIIEGAPRVNEDTMPGELANVVAGRVSNLLDLQGPNFAMDAACASSLATVMDACRLLQMRQVDVMIAGATDRSMDAPTFAKFSAIGALSASHSTPFDAGANGFVMGEGAGAFVLKRLSDAIRDGDDVHAVIRGVGGSSDGRGKGITAPSQRGQIQAIARAYSQAGYDATSVELIEAHGTSTKVGDATELGTLALLWDGTPNGNHVAVGSIKSQIGHLKAAAGIAGLIKAVMALHHRTIPPSAGFKTPNPTVDWESNPFFVPIKAREWPRPETHPRRAGVSAFGFGGTNYHVALEGFEPEFHSELAQKWDLRWDAYAQTESAPTVTSNAASVLDKSATPSMTHDEMKAIEGGILLLSATDLRSLQTKLEAVEYSGTHFDEDPRGLRLSSALNQASSTYDASESFRMCIVATSWAEFHKRTALASKAMNDPEKWGFLQAQGVLLTNDPALHPKAKIAHMYPGQGSQYVGMTHDLHQRYSAVQDVWSQADETMVEVLDGESLSSFVLRSNLSKEERIEAEHKLKQTEYTQPAMLTADLAIERALNDHGQMPDMVAGHSLGEYAALMSAGILDMDGALRASAARGTEMGSVVIDDKGLMASVMAPYEEVAAVLESIDGYVIAANKNSPKMTVVAGETAPVQQAMAVFEEKGFQCVPLATSHAFHSRIVAPANEPLRRFLESLEIRWPNIPITANVDGTFYPMEGEDSKAGILEKLAPQMASAVEWTTQIETMYAAGARAFIEVGPKRALTMFAVQILEGQPHLPIMSNHPKQGGIATFLGALGTLALAGRQPHWPADDSSVLTEAFRAGPLEAYQSSNLAGHSTAEMDDLRTRARPLPSTGGAESVVQQVVAKSSPSKSVDPEVAAMKAKNAYIGDRLAAVSGYPAGFCNGMVNLRLGLGMSDSDVSAVIKTIENEATIDASFDASNIATAADLAKWVTSLPSSWAPKSSLLQATSPQSTSPSVASSVGHVERRHTDPYVITGVSLGLPGGERVFDEDTFERLVRGETCLTEVSDEYKQRLLDKNIVRLIKGRDGSVNMEQATEFGDIPQLAGIKSAFDISEEFGIDPKVVLAWDITTQLAVAAGLLALRDAAIPLTPVEQIGKGGLRLIRNWEVPQHHRERTGIVFASCFPGLQMAMKHANNNGDDGEGRFDRRYLFQTLNMGHSQFAQYSGIRGPNTTINLACASSTAAFGVAEDWLNSDRVDRVVIISADDVTGDDLWEWIGGGFAASGAAATSNVIEEAALPFDRRRNGLVLGMGAAAFVVERHSEAIKRGVQPFAELLGTRTANSAFHGTRLNVEHVAETVNSFISSMENEWEIDRHEIAPNTVFFSHETYTPARGGSAQSEVRALRDTFGESTDNLVVANTKGFTGHPMGVGIEDASMFYGMKTGRIPPIANHKETDPELGNLNLSKGGDYPDIKYGLRFAAGFGSQMALSLVRKWPVIGERIDGQRFLSWSRNLADTDDVVLRILDNKLVAYVNGDDNLHGGVQGEPWPVTAAWEGMPSVATPASKPEPQIPVIIEEPIAQPEIIVTPTPAPTVESDYIATVIEVVVNHTGYPADFVELDQDLEGELGIDTVKQAEIMADIRERFSLPLDEEFVLSDYPTLNHMIGYIQRMTGGVSTPATSTTPLPVLQPVTIPEPSTTAPVLATDSHIQEQLIEVVVRHTGYPNDFIELDQDLEGELGIDTVKQAEIMADVRDIFQLPVDDEFVLSDHPTLNHFTAYIIRMKGGSIVDALPTPIVEQSEPVVVEAPVAKSEPPRQRQENCRRWQVEVEECLGTGSLLALDGTIVVTDDGWGIAEAFCQRVEARGMRAVRIGFESEIRDMSSHEESGRTVYRADPANPEHLALVCKELEQFDIAGLVHMAPLKLAGASWIDDTKPSSQIALAAHGYFSLLQGLDAHFATRKDGLVASVTALDGRHGNIGERFNSVQCAASGVTKSYYFEQTHLRMRALDLHPEIILDADQAAEQIESDLFELGGEIEIGLDRDGRRWTLVAFAEELEGELTPLQSDDTWIVSGGGSGVTAASVIGVACNSLNAGAHFALLGRSSLLEETETWVDWSNAQLEEQKNALREELMVASESGKVTMVEWNTAWRKYARSRDVYVTIKTIEETGNEASYHSVDVMDTEGLEELGSSLGRPITGIIHGAGLEDSKLVAAKDYNVFDNVIRVKIDGWQSLLMAVEASGGELRFASCFTSVSGRFGNNGQTDYSAANSVLDAEMARLTASGKCRAVAIAWTGWRDVGMATRGSFQAVFDAAGIDTISVEKGVELFVGEALQGGKRRVLGCGNLGTMDAFNAFRDSPLRLPAEMASIIADPYRFPFIDKVLFVDERQSMTTQTTLSVAEHPFLSDHAIEGVPYHPGVMALEMFAENALLLRPSACLAGFENVSFGLPVKLLKGEVTLRVQTELIRGDGEMSWIECRLVSDLSNSKGEIFGEREHHKAVVRVVERRDDLGPFLQAEVSALPQIGTPASGELAELPSFIYRRYFHGPRFQSHGGVLRGIGDAETPGADGIALMRHQLPMFDQFALESKGEAVLLEALPMLIEAGFQNAGLVAMESEGFSSLPVGIEWTSMLRVPERNEVLRMRSLRTAVEDAGITVHDVVIVGDDDAPVIALKGLRLKSMAPVPEEQSFSLER